MSLVLGRTETYREGYANLPSVPSLPLRTSQSINFIVYFIHEIMQEITCCGYAKNRMGNGEAERA